MKLENDLGTDNIKKLVLRLAIPSMLAQFVSVLYSIVDRMYIGNIPQIGETALAGVGICGPIVTLVSSFSCLIGFGGSPLLSIRMGEKNIRAAKQILANCFLMLCCIAVILTICSLLVKDSLLMWFGASTATFPYANQYLTIYLIGTPFVLLTMALNQFIICQGFAKTGMKSVIIGAVVNIVLDPIFIFVFDMGVAGAAIASVIAQIASCTYVLIFLFGKRVPIQITFRNYSWAICQKILLLGFSPFFIIAFDSILIITMNMVLQKYGGVLNGDKMVTCATIVQSFMLIITMPMAGITSGTQSILGYNYGAKKINRVRKGEKQILKVCIIFTSIMFILAQTVPQYFVKIFTQNPEYIDLSVWAIRVYTLGIIPLAFQYTFVDGFTGMGIAKIAILLSSFRKLMFFVFIFLLPMLFGVKAAFFTEPIVDFMGAAASIITYKLLIGKVLKARISRP